MIENTRHGHDHQKKKEHPHVRGHKKNDEGQKPCFNDRFDGVKGKRSPGSWIL
jgi:hypothetical protein